MRVRSDVGARRTATHSRATLSVAVSWFLWGIGYYAYFAYLSPYMALFVRPQAISQVYLLAGLAAIAYPAAGLITYRRFGARASISAWMAVAGLAISLMGLADGFPQFALLLSLNQAFYAALPSYYASLAAEEASYIPMVWALSVSPSLFMPALGGLLASRLGFAALFALSGALVASSLVPVALASGLRAEEGSASARGWALAIPAMIPVALESPYVFLVLERAYSLSSAQLGLVASAGEAVGMVAALALSRARWGISAALAGFSLTALLPLSWAFGIAFGFWEAIIPLSIAFVSHISGRPGVKFYTYLATLQALTFLTGYAASASVASIDYMSIPEFGGALAAALSAAYALLTASGGRGHRAEAASARAAGHHILRATRSSRRTPP